MDGEYSLERLSSEAKIEIGEANADLELEVRNLKSYLRDNHNSIKLPAEDFDHFYLKCLRARKFNVERAAKLIVKYFRLLFELSYLHEYMIPTVSRELFDRLAVTVLKQRDALGRAVIVTRQEQAPANEFHFDQSFAAIMLLVDQITKISEHTQRIGFVVIADLGGFSWAHFRQITPNRVRTLVQFFQNAFPARVKGFNFVRNPAVFSLFFALAKPFLSEKLNSRIRFHSHDFLSLQKHFSPEILPQYLGGKLPNDDYVDKDFTAGILKDDQYYMQVLKYAQKST